MCIEKVNHACSDSLTMVPLAESTTKLDLCVILALFSAQSLAKGVSTIWL